ncbi:MAG: LemA family protein [Crocinitomicaceae bacterium]|nr:LemA family protein [Crocinitomicaceae bacterium]
MSIQEEQFKEHLKQVAKAATQESLETGLEERPLTLDELRELAISMGLTSEGWEKLLVKAKTHLKSADDHLAARNFEQAIEEGNQAIGINPYIENGNAVLAKAHLMLWLEDGNSENAEKAEYHARKELAVDPKDQMAVNVLSTLNKKQKLLRKEGKSNKKIIIAVVVGAIALLALLLVLNSTTETKENKAIENRLIVAEEEVNEKWDLVQVQITRRNSLIPDLIDAVETSNEEVEIINQSIKALQDKIDKASGEERFNLENDLATKIQELKSSVKKYGNQSATEKLLIQIEGSENRIAFEKKNYNAAVKEYNILVKKNKDDFPSYDIKPYFNEK